MKIKLCIILSLVASFLYAQEDPFPFGQATYRELGMVQYAPDTNASAFVIREFGHAHIDNEGDHNLIFKYHVKIKVLKNPGIDQGNITIPLYKRNGKSERLRSVQASAFNIENGSLSETKLNTKQIFTENYKNGDLKKFAIPNVKIGSVIEYEYVVETPFFFMNFKPWEFQSDIPKMESEYWAIIPANFRYNMSLRGFQKLDKDENDILKDYFNIGGGRRADCVRFKWAMQNIPAFIEEEYMTAKKNFISAIRFELTQFENFTGSKDKITKEWKDADHELRVHDNFGSQLKKGKDIITPELDAIIKNENDPLQKARVILRFVQNWYRWNEENGYMSEAGIKKAFEKKSGNAADINLSLLALFRYAGLDADPVILSTRDNGWPTDLYPVLTEFNYVIVKLDIGEKTYLLDATEDFLPFGILPSRCLNGKGRVMAKKESYWYDIKPLDKAKVVVTMNLALQQDGSFSGVIQNTYMGYRAAEKRSDIYAEHNLEEYIKNKKNAWSNGEIKEITYTNLDDFTKPLVEKISVDLESVQLNNTFLVNPFIVERVSSNPFRSRERLYPVDFGVPQEKTMVINLALPEGFTLDELPEKIGLALPNNGGRYIFDVQQNGRMLTVSTSLLINRTLFDSNEYHFLKELYNRVVSMNRMDLVIKKI